MEGHGTFKTKQWRYIGSTNNDEVTGKGEILYKNGDKYEGPVIRG